MLVLTYEQAYKMDEILPKKLLSQIAFRIELSDSNEILSEEAFQVLLIVLLQPDFKWDEFNQRFFIRLTHFTK